MAGVTKNNQLLSANVRSLVLSQIQDVLLGDDEEFKKALLLKLSGSVLPRLNEISGLDGDPIKLNLINYGQIGGSLQLQTETIPTGTPESTTEVQNSGTTQESGQEQDGTQSTD